MMSREEVLKIAKLARLALSEDEIELYRERLGRVLDYMRELAEVKAPGDEFVRHVPKDSLPFRQDLPALFPDVEALLSIAPEMENRCFKLPKIVEQS